MSRVALLFLNGAILTVCAVFIYDARAWVLTGLMLFLPFMDKQWLNAQPFHSRLDLTKLFKRKPSHPRDSGVTSIGKYQDHRHNYSQLTGDVISQGSTNNSLPLLLSTALAGLILVWLHPQHAATALSIVLFTALPEEWFFRRYFMQSVEALILKYFSSSPCHNALIANITTSLIFSLNHIPTQGLTGLLIIFPSLLLGWLYQKYQSLTLVILLHALMNSIFFIYIKNHIDGILNWLQFGTI